MLLSYNLSLSDFLAAQHLFYWRNFSAKLTLLSQYLFFPLLGIAGICSVLLPLPMHVGSSAQPGILGASAAALAMPLIFRRNLKQVYKKTRISDGNYNFDFNEENIRTELPGYSKSSVEWQAVRQYQENKRCILIYIAPRMFWVIPKRILTPSQRDELMALLQRKVEPKKI